MEYFQDVNVWALIRLTAILLLAWPVGAVSKWLYRGYTIRKQVQTMKAQGLPTLPHSWILGHLAFFGEFRNEHPHDANIYNFHLWLMRDVERFFPGQKTLPPVIYLDVWPINVSGLLMVNTPELAAQFTQIKSMPKAKVSTLFLKPMTQNQDMVSNEGEAWKVWRTRMNPGFSTRNITALLPEIIEEIRVFVDGLVNLAGKDGSWGPVFQFEEKTTNLTFDVIIRAITGSRLHEQTRETSSPLKEALLSQIKHMGRTANAARSFLYSITPFSGTSIDRNNQAMHDFFMPKVQDRLTSGADQKDKKKTIVDLALKQFDEEGTGAKPDAEFFNVLLANLKTFLFAGHDTTATTICWMMKNLQDNPDCLAKLREEHDSVLGTNVEEAQKVILSQPHLLYALPYTLGVIKETLRLYPLAATLREGDPDFFLVDSESSMKFPTDGYAMWDGLPVIMRRPDLWPQGDEFMPERWMTSEGDPLHPPKDSWRPFEMGPRNCIGQELALVELRLVAVLLARRFDFEEAWAEWDLQQGKKGPQPMVNGERLYRVGDGTVHTKDSMPVHIRLRS